VTEPRLLSLVEALRRLHAHAGEHAHDIRHCERCHTFTEHALCDVCADPGRDVNVLCIVETPADQSALERTGSYKGLYFVLMGRLSPLDGVGVRDIGVGPLLDRIEREPVGEVILATSFTAEGEATSHVIGAEFGPLGLTSH
jgi:recombination protein RecR